MEKVLLFDWLSEVHSKRETGNVTLPKVPALAQFVQFSNDFSRNDRYFQEVMELENASGIQFAEYCLRHQQPPILHGTSPFCPIIIDDDASVDDDSFHSARSAPWSYSFRSSDCSQGSVVEDEFPVSVNCAQWSCSYTSTDSGESSHGSCDAPNVTVDEVVAVSTGADAVSFQVTESAPEA